MEILTDAGTRALYAADASNYRVVPEAVAVPRTVDELVEAVAACRERGLPLVPRGAGTSVAGNAIGGFVVDTSRWLTRCEVDPESRTAYVEPGVVLDDLRRAAAGHGLTFGPDPSTASRCTLGGMIGNNACGTRSVAYGTTADNVESLDVLLYDGTRFTADLLTSGNQPDRITEAVRRLVAEHELLIRRRFSGFSRQVSGYALDALLPDGGGPFDRPGADLARALVGSEGTCATVLGATVRLVELPAAKALLVLGFPDAVTAADVVPAILPHRPLTVEGINAALVERLPPEVRSAAAQVLPEGTAWLLVEITGETVVAAGNAAERLGRELGTSYAVLTDAGAQQVLWRVRRDGVGLATRRSDGSEAWPGWEDAAVPPERLGRYLREFDDLLAEYGYSAGVYGHFGEGCLHARIDFDLMSPAGVKRFRGFVEQAADLVIAHGGSVSGEHGDGRARSELLRRMYGDDLVAVFERFKAIFDPGDRMNPGVLVRPARLDADLRVGPGRELPVVFGYPHDGGSFAAATRRCVGVGKCRQHNAGDGVMCPSWQVTHDERHSTRGRAHLLAELVRGDLVTDGWRSTEVRDALDLCLACKGCLTDCPVNVDMATYKAEFLHHHYKRRLRPVSHYSMGWLPLWAGLATATPLTARLVNAAGRTAAAKRLAGVARQRTMPPFATRTAVRQLRRRPPGDPDRPAVLLWPDTLVNHVQPEIALAAARVLEHAGLRVVVPREPVCCGLPWISTGQLGVAQRVLRRSLRVLQRYGDLPVLGLEPSCTAVLRSDGPDLLGGQKGPMSSDTPGHKGPMTGLYGELSRGVAERTRTLAELLAEYGWQPPGLGVDALVQVHCHQHAVLGFDPDAALLEAAGVRVERVGGCCGLAGNFGFERRHYDVSM
ncbi:MAG TPA: FAD-binding and (Fe-S)-binding domain-containing protein, partial [Kribbellaceae bacterium]